MADSYFLNFLFLYVASVLWDISSDFLNRASHILQIQSLSLNTYAFFDKSIKQWLISPMWEVPVALSHIFSFTVYARAWWSAFMHPAGLSKFSNVPVLHYLQVLLFLKNWTFFMNILYSMCPKVLTHVEKISI
jgi:hypothetical protein